MSSARRVAFGRQIDRREIARNPREARANMEVIDLATKRRAEAQAAKAAIEDQPAMVEDSDQQETADEQETQDEGPATEKAQSSHVRIRYDGTASRFRIAGYVFKAGDVVAVERKHSDEILTYPFERFSLVKE